MPALLEAPIFLRRSLVAVSLELMVCVPHLTRLFRSLSA